MRAAEAVPAVLAAVAALALLYAAWCAFTWAKFRMFDYGVYTNFIYNCGHGEGFRVLVDRSYLGTHLSFTLALLGPLFRLWDHPFLPALCQWLMLAGGGGILAAAARRLRVPRLPAFALLLFWFGYILPQRVLLAEFHGVSAYFLLVPWLYYALRFRRSMAWLPLLLLLGVREEAGLFLLPMLFYFPIRNQWKAGWLLPAFALGYTVLAVLVLYPAINGMSLFDRRAGSVEGVGELLDAFTGHSALLRLGTLCWALLPVVAVVRRRWLPALLFPSAALLQALLSGSWRQQGLMIHYGAPVMAMLGVGLLEAMTASREEGNATAWQPFNLFWTAGWLTVLTCVAHLLFGLLPGGGRSEKVYLRPHLSGRVSMSAVGHLNKDGILLCEDYLAGFAANRSDILNWGHYRPEQHAVSQLLTELPRLERSEYAPFLAGLQDRSWGVRFTNGEHVILEKGFDPADNERVLQMVENRLIKLAWTRQHGGQTVFDPERGAVRTWMGDGRKSRLTLCYRSHRILKPGRYRAVLTYEAAIPSETISGSWGRLLLVRNNRTFEEAELPPVPTKDFSVFELPFTLQSEGPVEPRIEAGDAPLRLDSVHFVMDE